VPVAGYPKANHIQAFGHIESVLEPSKGEVVRCMLAVAQESKTEILDNGSSQKEGAAAPNRY
jgi:hypothetical protein